MPRPMFSLRLQRLATWLSFLALWSALVAPASVLAQEMRSGKWTALCSAGLAAPSGLDAPDSHAAGEGGHCELCALPGLAPTPSRPHALFADASASTVARLAPAPLQASRLALPGIRGPPTQL